MQGRGLLGMRGAAPIVVGLALAWGALACSQGSGAQSAGGARGGATGGTTGGMGGGALTGSGGVTPEDAAIEGPDAQGPAGGAGGGQPGDVRDTAIADVASDASSGAGDLAAEDCDEYVMPADCTIPDGAVLPGDLRCTGLYSDWPSRTLRCGVRGYAPAYALWSDGAGKQRYVWLPPGGAVDATDPDNFDYPLGTRFWKEFHVGPEGQQRLGETRYLLKVKGGWLYTSYVWSADGTTAKQNNDGVDDLFGTGHSVPTRDQCKTCHSGRPEFVLGWDFIMLGRGATGVTAKELVAEGKLKGMDPALLDIAVPGDDVERAALSYMHANCGISCHNNTPNATGKPSGLFLRLEVAELGRVLDTDAVRSGINRLPSPNANYGDIATPDGGFYDFRPQDTERSLSLARMRFRGTVTAMPPIGTHQMDPEGVAALAAWIVSMTPERGYPAPAP
jgi:hypothetical protein